MRRLAWLTWLIAPLSAGATEWKFVETDLSLRPDGKATIVYRVAIDPQGMQLHGFYFQGYTGRPHFDFSQCYALGPDGSRHALDIKDLGDKYDVVLSGGKAIGRGQVIYVLTYGTDLATTGHLARTTSSEGGELAVLNWSPVQWDDRLGHYTLKIYWPATVPGTEVSPEELARLKLLTEKFMNESYKMDYFGTQRNGKYWLTQRIHWESVPVKGRLRVQEYVDASLFSSLPAAARQLPAEAPPEAYAERPARSPVRQPVYSAERPRHIPPGVTGLRGERNPGHILVLAAILTGVFVVVIGAKHRSMLTASNGLKEISWLEADWTPPQIVLSSYRKTGKIPDLEAIEAAVFLGIPFKPHPEHRPGGDADQGGCQAARRRPHRHHGPLCKPGPI